MVEGLTYIEDSRSMLSRVQFFALQFFKAHTIVANIHRGVEQWQLVGLITRRSGVRIPSPLPNALRPFSGRAFSFPGSRDLAHNPKVRGQPPGGRLPPFPATKRTK